MNNNEKTLKKLAEFYSGETKEIHETSKTYGTWKWINWNITSRVASIEFRSVSEEFKYSPGHEMYDSLIQKLIEIYRDKISGEILNACDKLIERYIDSDLDDRFAKSKSEKQFIQFAKSVMRD